MGYIIHLPSDDQRDRVERLAKLGATEEDIASELQIPLKRLRKRYRRQLERGAAKGRNEMLHELFEKAKSGSNMTATSLWVKARCGWRDTGAGNHTSAVIHSLLHITRRSNEDQPNPA